MTAAQLLELQDTEDQDRITWLAFLAALKLQGVASLDVSERELSAALCEALTHAGIQGKVPSLCSGERDHVHGLLRSATEEGILALRMPEYERMLILSDDTASVLIGAVAEEHRGGLVQAAKYYAEHYT